LPFTIAEIRSIRKRQPPQIKRWRAPASLDAIPESAGRDAIRSGKK
jgi:hypothetical protein